MKIDSTVTDLSPQRRPVQIHTAYHRKLELLCLEQGRIYGRMVEMLIDQEWARTHPQPITIEEEIGRR